MAGLRRKQQAFKQAISYLCSMQQLYAYLSQYLTPARQALFERVLNYRTRHLTVAVEDLYQERNASAVLRSCECFGVQDVHIIENYNKYRISSGIAKGAEEWLSLHIYDDQPNNSLACIRRLRQQGYRIIATTPHTHDCLISEYDISQKSAFFFGGEKPGLSQTVMQQADGFVKIPMVGVTESFNISVAAAIVLYELTRRLHQRQDIPWQLTGEERLQLKVEWALRSIRSGKKLLQRYLQEKGLPQSGPWDMGSFTK